MIKNQTANCNHSPSLVSMTVKEAKDGIGATIDTQLDSYRSTNAGINLNMKGLDQRELYRTLGDDLRAAVDALAASGCIDDLVKCLSMNRQHEDILDIDMVINYQPNQFRFDDFQSYVNDAYTEPTLSVDEWVDMHMGGSVRDWLVSIISTDNDGAEGEFAIWWNWNIPAAVERVESLLAAEELTEDTTPEEALGYNAQGDRWGTLLSSTLIEFYTEP